MIESYVAHEHDSASAPTEGAQYDFAAIQDKWLPVWDELKPFATADPTDVLAADALRTATELRIQFVLAESSAIEAAIEKH